MESTGTSNSSVNGNRTRHWLRVLRPFGWWFLLVLVLFGIRTHQRLMEQTRLTFSVTVEGQKTPSMDVAAATMDRHTIESGQNIPLGRHTFTLTHPKGEPFMTNLFVWYGQHDFGLIILKRAKGVLDLRADPKAPLLIVRGPEFTQTLTNSPGISISLPTDIYSIEARYAHWEHRDEVTVVDRCTNAWRIAPRLGALDLSCNREGASFELIAADNRIIEAGGFPATALDVPEGNYKIVTQHHHNRREENITVKYGATNNVKVELLYGTAILATEPPNAAVLTANGHEWGVTPITLNELPLGIWHFTLRLDGYESAEASLEIAADGTASFRTNLVSRNYTAAMNAAEHYFSVGEFTQAEKAADDALLAKRDDPAAL